MVLVAFAFAGSVDVLSKCIEYTADLVLSVSLKEEAKWRTHEERKKENDLQQTKVE